MEEEKEQEKIPRWQLFYDDIFLIFMLGMVIPLLCYIIWGLMDIASVPVAGPVEKPKGFGEPGTFILAVIFLVVFSVYYFLNWKWLANVWPVG